MIERIKIASNDDTEQEKIRLKVKHELRQAFKICDGALRFGTRICITNILEQKRELLNEAHRSPYTIHPSNTRMYRDLQDILVTKYKAGD